MILSLCAISAGVGRQHCGPGADVDADAAQVRTTSGPACPIFWPRCTRKWRWWRKAAFVPNVRENVHLGRVLTTAHCQEARSAKYKQHQQRRRGEDSVSGTDTAFRAGNML